MGEIAGAGSKTPLRIFEDSIIRRIKERASIIWIKSYDKEYIYEVLRNIIRDEENPDYSFNIEPDKVSTWNIANGTV